MANDQCLYRMNWSSLGISIRASIAAGTPSQTNVSTRNHKFAQISTRRQVQKLKFQWRREMLWNGRRNRTISLLFLSSRTHFWNTLRRIRMVSVVNLVSLFRPTSYSNSDISSNSAERDYGYIGFTRLKDSSRPICITPFFEIKMGNSRARGSFPNHLRLARRFVKLPYRNWISLD